MKNIKIELQERSYNIHIEKGSLYRIGEIFKISNKRAFILTDSGVPKMLSETVSKSFSSSFIYTVDMGEGAKSLDVFGDVLAKMLEIGIGRNDVLISVGGGVVGDLGGFAASAYMRGIDFYNVPTTLLSMVDSSIGGKTAINHGGYKNVVGAFYQPKGVLIDTIALETLENRQVSCGFAEVIKMAATSNQRLFSDLENIVQSKTDIEGGILSKVDIEDIIYRSLLIKKYVVEQDEREGGLRKILNFGHTFGHAIEAQTQMNTYTHGECVGLGMLAVTKNQVHKRIKALLEKYGLPTEYNEDTETILKYVEGDKKRDGDCIDVVLVEEIGRCEIQRMPIADFKELIINNRRDFT